MLYTPVLPFSSNLDTLFSSCARSLEHPRTHDLRTETTLFFFFFFFLAFVECAHSQYLCAVSPLHRSSGSHSVNCPPKSRFEMAQQTLREPNYHRFRSTEPIQIFLPFSCRPPSPGVPDHKVSNCTFLQNDGPPKPSSDAPGRLYHLTWKLVLSIHSSLSRIQWPESNRCQTAVLESSLIQYFPPRQPSRFLSHLPMSRA